MVSGGASAVASMGAVVESNCRSVSKRQLARILAGQRYTLRAWVGVQSGEGEVEAGSGSFREPFSGRHPIRLFRRSSVLVPTPLHAAGRRMRTTGTTTYVLTTRPYSTRSIYPPTAEGRTLESRG